MTIRTFSSTAGRLFTVMLLGILVATGCAGVAPHRGASGATEPAGDDLERANELFLAGKMAETRDNWGDAIAAYMEALEYDPGAGEIAFAIASSFLHNGMFRSSLNYARLATDLDDDEAEYWQLVQYLEERLGSYENAADALEHYMKLIPERTFLSEMKLVQYYFALDRTGDARKILLDRANDVHTPAGDMYEIARALAFNDMDGDAVKVLENLIDRDPLDVEAWLYLGNLFSDMGEDERALETYQKALENNPDNTFVLVTIGNECLLNNDWECAISYLEQAAAAGPGKAQESGIDYTDILRTLTAVYYYGDHDADAKALFDSLVESGDDDAGFYFSLGKTMTYLERYGEAVAYYQTGFETGLDNVSPDMRLRALSGLAVALVNDGQSDEALRVIHEDAPGYISDTSALKSLEASIYMELEQYEDAITLYAWLAAADPSSMSYLYSLSLACDMAGRFDDAEAALLKVLDDDPEDALALNNLAYMYLEHDTNTDQALAMVRQALIVDPENGAYLDTLAWAYYKQGDYKKARKEIERALKWAGDDDAGVIYEHYGDILGAMGKTKDAAEAYRNAIEYGEDADRIDAKLDALDR